MEGLPNRSIKVAGNNYPTKIKRPVAEKRKSRKKWQQNKAPIDNNRLNNLAQRLRRMIQQIKNETISLYLRTLTAEKDINYSS